MTTEEEAREFDELLAKLAQANSLPWAGIWSIFDDETEMHEVMWGLVHLIEDRPETYVPELVAGFESMREGAAPEWAELLVKRVLNNPDTRSLLVGAMGQSAFRVDGLLRFLNHLAETKPPPLGVNAKEAIDAFMA